MEELIEKFIKARGKLLKTIDSFPEEKQEKILFDKWNLKDMMTHLDGWANYQLETLKQFKNGINLEIPHNLKESINESFVAERASWVWDRVYDEFLKASQDLINEYESLPERLWEKKIWNDKETTPKEFIQIEISHYENTHEPQIQRVLKRLSK